MPTFAESSVPVDTIAAPYPSGNQPFIPQPRKAASAPRLQTRRW